MAEAVGVAAGILALVTTAYSSTQALYKTIQDFRHAPQDIQHIAKEVEDLRGVLDLLKQKVHHLKDTIGLEEALKGCTAACSEFRQMIEESNKHRKGERHSTRDRVAWIYKGKKQSKDFRTALASYKDTLNIALGAETL